jgi:hypothetical protein
MKTLSCILIVCSFFIFGACTKKKVEDNASVSTPLGKIQSQSTSKGIAIDPSGNIIVAGDVASTTSGIIGQKDIFVEKFSSTGSSIWTARLGSTNGTTLTYGVAVNSTTGDVNVVGTSTGPVNGYVKIGHQDGLMLYGSNNAYYIEYDSSGNLVSVKGHSANAISHGRTVTSAPDGSSYMAGYTYGGVQNQTQIGLADYYITKYSTNGSHIWTVQNGVPGAGSSIEASVVDSQGNFVGAGFTTGNINETLTGSRDCMIVKTNNNGNLSWIRQFGSANKETSCSAVSVDTNGNIYASGTTFGPIGSNTFNSSGTETDRFLAKYSATGEQIWIKQFGVSTGSSTATGLTANTSEVSKIFGVGTENNVGYLIRFDSNGNED